MEEYVKYLEELFVSIKWVVNTESLVHIIVVFYRKSHKEFLTDLYHKIDLPLKGL